MLNSLIALCCFIGFAGCQATAQTTFNWPCFHGPDRTNKSSETGLLKKWPENGPRLIWTASGLGEGFSSVTIGDGLIFTAGLVNRQPFVFAFDLKGNLVWKKPNGKAWSTTASWALTYLGPRSSPTYDNGVVYHLGEMGRLTAFDSKTGKEIWSRDLMEEFDAGIPEYGYTESVLVDGDFLYTRPAGKKGHQICLNKHTGKLVWANTQIPGLPGYTSPVIHKLGSYRFVVGASADCFYGVDTGTGKLLWKVDFKNSENCNISDAILFNEYVFMSSSYGGGSKLVRLNISGKEIIPETVWESKIMDNHHGGVILHNGFLYGSGSSPRGWYCLDFITGKQLWKIAGDEGSLTYADDMLYMLDQKGTIRLVRASPDKYEISGVFKVPSGGTGMYWAHPVICDGRLYLRHADKIYAYDIKEK